MCKSIKIIKSASDQQYYWQFVSENRKLIGAKKTSGPQCTPLLNYFPFKLIITSLDKFYYQIEPFQSAQEHCYIGNREKLSYKFAQSPGVASMISRNQKILLARVGHPILIIKTLNSVFLEWKTINISICNRKSHFWFEKKITQKPTVHSSNNPLWNTLVCEMNTTMDDQWAPKQPKRIRYQMQVQLPVIQLWYGCHHLWFFPLFNAKKLLELCEMRPEKM